MTDDFGRAAIGSGGAVESECALYGLVGTRSEGTMVQAMFDGACVSVLGGGVVWLLVVVFRVVAVTDWLRKP